MSFAKCAKATPTYFRALPGALGFTRAPMPAPVDFNSAIQAFERLLELQNPDMVQYWNPPALLRGEYIRLAETVVYAQDTLRAIET